MKLSKVKIFEPKNPNKATRIVGGKSSGIVVWNDLRYPHFYERYKQLLSTFWTPFEINMSDDKKQWDLLEPIERRAFLRIIGLLSVLDSVQPRYLAEVASYTSDPSVSNIIYIIMQQEVVHNHSYSYVVSSVVNAEIEKQTFDDARTDELILKRNMPIIDAYNEFKEEKTVLGLCKTLVQSTILEGINFYSGFAFFYNLARYGKMVGTSTMISYINRDEMLHGTYIAELLRIILTENPEIDADGSFSEYTYEAIRDAVELEIEWSEEVLSGLEGIDINEMKQYVRYLGNKRLRVLGLDDLFEADENVMPWIQIFGDQSFNTGKSDFFETKSRQYTKTSEDNGFDDL